MAIVGVVSDEENNFAFNNSGIVMSDGFAGRGSGAGDT